MIIFQNLLNFFPESFGGRVKDELDLSDCATKADLKNATGVDTLDFANLATNTTLNAKINYRKIKTSKFSN